MGKPSRGRIHWTRRLYRFVNQQISPIAFSMTLDDHAVIADALRVRSGDRVVCLASSGDTPLNLLVHNPGWVDAVDVSLPQLHLLQLKMTAATALGLEGLRELLGAGPLGDIMTRYDAVRGHLPLAERAFWDDNRGMLARGVLWEGAVLRLARAWAPLARWRAERTGRLPRIDENPYLGPTLLRRLPPERFLPPYLSADQFGTIASRVDRIRLHFVDIRRFLQTCDDDSVDCFALSNVLDWLTRPDADLLLGEIARVGRRGSRVLLCARRRTAYLQRDLAARFVLDAATSRRLQLADRVHYFRYFHCLEVRKDLG